VVAEYENKSHPLAVPLAQAVGHVLARDGEGPEVVDRCREVEDAGSDLELREACDLVSAILIRERTLATRERSNAAS